MSKRELRYNVLIGIQLYKVALSDDSTYMRYPWISRHTAHRLIRLSQIGYHCHRWYEDWSIKPNPHRPSITAVLTIPRFNHGYQKLRQPCSISHPRPAQLLMHKQLYCHIISVTGMYSALMIPMYEWDATTGLRTYEHATFQHVG